jgi:hypothetical protein
MQHKMMKKDVSNNGLTFNFVNKLVCFKPRLTFKGGVRSIG